MRNRRGMSLVELLVGLVVASVLAASLVKLATHQSRLVMMDEGRGEARSVSHSAVTLLSSDIRMVEASQGTVHADPDSVTLRVPYSMGIVCTASATSITAAMMPVDSVELAEAGPSGYAWRDGTGTYQYTETSLTLTAAANTICTTQNIDPIPGGQIVTIAPGSALAYTGAPIMLYQQIRYAFRNSALEPGTIGLWRSVLSRNLHEELAAPFDASAGFRFYIDGTPTPQATPPAVNQIRGLEIQLTGYNRRAGTVTAAEQTPLVTSIFYKNR